MLVLTASDVEKITSSFKPSELQTLMARVFALSSSKTTQVDTPHRISVATANHTVLFMPAHISEPTLLGTTVKVVSVPRSKEDTRGLPATTMVLDEDTGGVKAIVNARSLTAIRNAAGSLLSTNIVRQSPPIHLVAFGAGKQIEMHLDLHLKFFSNSIKSCTIVNRSYNSRIISIRNILQSRFPAVGFTFIISGTDSSRVAIQETLREADVVICATSSSQPLFTSSWIRARTHVILIGSYTPHMREVDRDLVMRAVSQSKEEVGSGIQMLMVDSRDACASEAGELIEAGVTGDQVREIGELVPLNSNGDVDLGILNVPPELDQDFIQNRWQIIKDDFTGPITMFKSVGIGLQDVAIACAVLQSATSMNGRVGTLIHDYDGATV